MKNQTGMKLEQKIYEADFLLADKTCTHHLIGIRYDNHKMNYPYITAICLQGELTCAKEIAFRLSKKIFYDTKLSARLLHKYQVGEKICSECDCKVLVDYYLRFMENGYFLKNEFCYSWTKADLSDAFLQVSWRNIRLNGMHLPIDLTFWDLKIALGEPSEIRKDNFLATYRYVWSKWRISAESKIDDETKTLTLLLFDIYDPRNGHLPLKYKICWLGQVLSTKGDSKTEHSEFLCVSNKTHQMAVNIIHKYTDGSPLFQIVATFQKISCIPLQGLVLNRIDNSIDK